MNVKRGGRRLRLRLCIITSQHWAAASRVWSLESPGSLLATLLASLETRIVDKGASHASL